MYEQTCLFFSLVYDDLVLRHNDLLTIQTLCLSLFSTKTMHCLNIQNFDLYYLIENEYELVYYL